MSYETLSFLTTVLGDLEQRGCGFSPPDCITVTIKCGGVLTRTRTLILDPHFSHTRQVLDPPPQTLPILD